MNIQQKIKKKYKGPLQTHPILLVRNALSKYQANKFKQKFKMIFKKKFIIIDPELQKIKSIQKIIVLYKNKIKFEQQVLIQIQNIISQDDVYFNELNENLRIMLWQKVAKTLEMQNDNQDYFMQLISQNQNYYEKIIQLDINRTANQSDEQFRDPMNRVLLAYSTRNPNLGYCQGLNYILLELFRNGFQEQQSFWMLTYLIEIVLPIDYYTNMFGLLVDQKILKIMLDLELPDLSEKFRLLKLDTSIFSIIWFTCLFTRTLHNNMIKIFIDNLICFGSISLFKAAISIFKIFKQKLMMSENFNEIYNILTNELMALDDCKQFQHQMNQIYISQRILDVIRESQRQLHEKEFFFNKEKSNQKEKAVCQNMDSQICDFFLEQNQKMQTEMFLYRLKDFPQLIKCYVDQMQSQLAAQNRQDILMGRQFHICDPYDDFEQLEFKQKQTINQEIELPDMNPEQSEKIFSQRTESVNPQMLKFEKNSKNFQKSLSDQKCKSLNNITVKKQIQFQTQQQIQTDLTDEDDKLNTSDEEEIKLIKFPILNQQKSIVDENLLSTFQQVDKIHKSSYKVNDLDLLDLQILLSNISESNKEASSRGSDILSQQ